MECGDDKDKCQLEMEMEMKVRIADGEQRGFVGVNSVGYEVRSKPESGDSGIAMPLVMNAISKVIQGSRE